MSKERPILFSGPMVRAILEGRKTVTRRPVKRLALKWLEDGFETSFVANPDNALCPYGQPGDRLWVRESFTDLRGTGIEHRPDPAGPLHRYAFAADSPPGSHSDEVRKDYGIKWKPSIHMPREACRILLEITDVRVERLQDISEEQAIAEGCFFTDYGRKCGHGGKGWKDVGNCPAPKQHHPQLNGWMWDKTSSDEQCLGTARWAFGNLWEKTGGDWDGNPWVWCVSFRRIEP